MKRKLLFPLIAALLLAPWPVAYAYDEVLAVNSPGNIEPAEEAAAPRINAYGHSIGGVTPGDLFYVESADTTNDMHLTLYITNADELFQQYRYMNLKIGIYMQTDSDQWEEVTWGEEEAPRDIYITMHSGMTEFTLRGYANYKITVDKGCFYCYGAGANGNAAFPQFYLTSG
jgi:hypothetical protein